MLLIEEVKALIRDGLIRDYHTVDDSVDVLRGRLRVREQFLRRYGQLHRIECSFDEFDGDIPENQMLAAALLAGGAERLRALCLMGTCFQCLVTIDGRPANMLPVVMCRIAGS